MYIFKWNAQYFNIFLDSDNFTVQIESASGLAEIDENLLISYKVYHV